MINRMTDQLILLTGCINPNGMAYTKLQNPETRRAHYIDSIKYYLLKTQNKILFVENSEIDISKEFERDKERLEFLIFSGNDYDKKLGKGHGEMLILKYAFANSDFIKHATSICKITGRYKVKNIQLLLTHYAKCDCEVMVDLLHQLRYSDSRIFIANKPFFNNYLFYLKKQVDDSNGYYFEHALQKAVLMAIMDNKSYLPFKYKPRILGTSGTENSDYNSSFWNWIVRYKKQKDNFKYFTTAPEDF